MKKVSVEQTQYILDDFFKVEEAYLRFEKFDGEMSPRLRFLRMERGNAAAVLVLNRTTDRLILIRQFRYPTYPDHAWMIETIAGIVDAGETPQEAARREVQEEIGLAVEAIEPIAAFYTSPGGSSEQVFLYFSEVAGEQAAYQKNGGLVGSGEDIEVVELTLDEALARVKNGEIVDGKTILALYWLVNRQNKWKHDRQEDKE